jgi:methionine synthase I (cobalamin-dependent)
MESFRNLLETDRIHVFDGAMGTMLYAKGVYINRCYDELSLSNPDLVHEIHCEYTRLAPLPTTSISMVWRTVFET